MIPIGICDDQPEHLNLLTSFLGRHPRHDEFTIGQATTSESFLALLAGHSFSIVFLDIDMAGMDGIQLGELVKRERPDTIIVYVTAHEEYALDAYRVRAFHYLVKPLSMEALHSVLDEALAALGRMHREGTWKIFTVQKKGEIISLEYEAIFYFEKVGHKIQVAAGDRSFGYYGNFSGLLGQLEAGSFLQCHQGYIVNIGKVRVFRDKILYLDGGREIPVSRSCSDRVREALAQRLFNGRGMR